jgi:hypothetical protein
MDFRAINKILRLAQTRNNATIGRRSGRLRAQDLALRLSLANAFDFEPARGHFDMSQMAAEAAGCRTKLFVAMRSARR